MGRGNFERGKVAHCKCKVWGRSAMSCAKMAEPIEMPFGLRTWMGPRNHVLDGGSDPSMGRSNFKGEIEWHIVNGVATLFHFELCKNDCGLLFSGSSSPSHTNPNHNSDPNFRNSGPLE